MRYGSVLLVFVAFETVPGLGGMVGMGSAQTSIGFSHPDSMEALLSYRLPDWGYRTISLQLGFLGNGEKQSPCYFCQEATSTSASEELRLQWYQESEERIWSFFAGQTAAWNWNQTTREPEDAIASNLDARLFASASNRNYLTGNLFLLETASTDVAYEEARTQEGSERDLIIGRSFRGGLNLGLGLGRIRDVTPVLQAQRLSERIQALGRPALPVGDVLRLASVLAQEGGYLRVFDRPDRQLWRDVLDPLVARGETLTPFEVFYLSDVFHEALGSRSEGFRVEVSGQVQRNTRDNGNSIGGTSWGPNVHLNWSHNLSLDHELSASASALYAWSDSDTRDGRRELGITTVTFVHQWVLADRFLWTNLLRHTFLYSESPLPSSLWISRQQNARLRSIFDFYVEDRVRIGPVADVTWRHSESEGGWFEHLNWTLQLNLTYDLDNTLF